MTQPKRKIRPPKVERRWGQPRSEVKAEDVYALIESTLSRTVTEVSDDPFSAGQAATEPSARAPEEVPPTRSLPVASSVLPRSRWQSVIAPGSVACCAVRTAPGETHDRLGLRRSGCKQMRQEHEPPHESRGSGRITACETHLMFVNPAET